MSAPHEIQPALAKLSGTVLESRYRLGRVLGWGGMGAVFEATQLRLSRSVAVKILLPAKIGDDRAIKRFLKEATAASKVDHRNVVKIIDSGASSDGLYYLVMELLHGQDLQQFLDKQPNKCTPWNQSVDILVQLAAGVNAIHSCGVVHRDIKPLNCFLTTEDNETFAKVLDFGIAKISQDEEIITRPLEMPGTPAYMAPELVERTASPSDLSDIYSFGALAYRMLTGHTIFSGGWPSILIQIMRDPPVRPRRHVPEIPPGVEDFILKLVAKKPEERPASMSVVRDALVALKQDPTRLPPLSEADPPLLPSERETLSHFYNVPVDIPPLPSETETKAAGSAPEVSVGVDARVNTPVDVRGLTSNGTSKPYQSVVASASREAEPAQDSDLLPLGGGATESVSKPRSKDKPGQAEIFSDPAARPEAEFAKDPSSHRRSPIPRILGLVAFASTLTLVSSLLWLSLSGDSDKSDALPVWSTTSHDTEGNSTSSNDSSGGPAPGDDTLREASTEGASGASTSGASTSGASTEGASGETSLEGALSEDTPGDRDQKPPGHDTKRRSSDQQLEIRVARAVKTRCFKSISDRPITLWIEISPDGTLSDVITVRDDEVSKCARKQVRQHDGKFRKRHAKSELSWELSP